MVWQTRPDASLHHLLGAAIGYGVLVAVEVFYRRVRGKDGLGRGDAKLVGALGMWIAWPGLAPLLLVASFSGLAYMLATNLVQRRALMNDTPLAFGPFIALGGWVVWLMGTPGLPY